MKSTGIIAFMAIVLLLAYSNNSKAQTLLANWNPSPTLHTIDKSYNDESAVVLEDSRVHQYKTVKDDMFVFCEQKKIVKVNSDKGVEMFNKIYINYRSGSEVVKIKARAILPNGKVINLPEDKIFDEEEDGFRYKKFALEGVEKGGEIEYYSLIKYPVYTFGIETYAVNQTPVLTASFELKIPSHLYFDVKGFNGFKVNSDTIINNERVTTAHAENIVDFESEKYSMPGAYYANVQYKLSYNLDKDRGVRMNTWGDFAKNVYANYTQFNKKEEKALDGFYKNIKLERNASEEEKIIAIEDYVKHNINVNANGIGDDADVIERIVKTKVAGEFGVTRLMIGLLQRAQIQNQLVFPGKRDEKPLDETFENFRLTNSIVLYFPSTGKYLSPGDVEFRYPIINTMLGGTKGIFIKELTLGNIKSATPVFDSIELLPYEGNKSNMEVSLSFNKSLDTLNIQSKQILQGYSAANYRPAYAFLSKDKQDDFTKSIIKNIANTDSVISFSVENADLKNSLNNLPLNILGNFKSVDLHENAGKNILVKIGEVIGTQVQMYQEKKRVLPISLDYPHALDRIITFTIPDGYKIKNPDDIVLNVTDKNGSGKETMGFISGYKIQGKELIITIHEFYKSIYYDVNKIDEFSKVINAAADFNKVTLVLEKISN